ncbi:MAG: hypothetical protein SOW44_06930 [Porphyromonas sp.]|nr:hypothetical protein [Bacteroidales bacterium]MDD7559562.1 hypothetical protein [Bacteroidales bacterium]MDY3101053.1 hypothetical protein [Porphyromonas sp.]
MTTPPQSSPQTLSVRRSENLYALGLVLVVLSSLAYFLFDFNGAAWMLAVSGGLMAVAMMLKGAFDKKQGSSATRSSRLDRMRLIGGLMFLVSGGFAIEGQNLWILLFAGGTVFTLYGIFVGDKVKK